MDLKPRLPICALALLSLLLTYGCALHRVQCVRPPLPQELQADPPPPGTFQSCLTELEAGSTSGPACSNLPKLPTS